MIRILLVCDTICKKERSDGLGLSHDDLYDTLN